MGKPFQVGNIISVVLFVTLFSVVALAQSKTVVISDIDDTLKTSSVRSIIRKIAYAKLTQNRFYGMNRLFQWIEKETQAKFFYVSNAPEPLMEDTHNKFLALGKFPAGETYFREDLGQDHKLSSIREIISSERPDLVIFFGDNGELDINYYEQILREFEPQGVRFITFIRIAYSEPEVLQPISEQIGFVTPTEVALVLQSEGLTSIHSSALFAQELTKTILEEKSPSAYSDQAFPRWMDCSAFKWPLLAVDPPYRDTFERLRVHIEAECALGASIVGD